MLTIERRRDDKEEVASTVCPVLSAYVISQQERSSELSQGNSFLRRDIILLLWIIFLCIAKRLNTSFCLYEYQSQRDCWHRVDSHLGGARFESREKYQIIIIVNFRGFSQSLQENTGIVPRLGHNRFFPNPFQFIRHPTTTIRNYLV
jgi:hypothetical protein